MNKTVTANLGGIVFHIDEDAYEMLNKYLRAIKSYFSQSDGCDEIMTDIESRIGEMFSEKIGPHKQVITKSNVEEVIAVMGKPEEFLSDEMEANRNQKQNAPQSGDKKRKRVFRDSDNKIVAGVCSGISAHFNTDPLWIRIAFAFAIVFFGSGFLLYLILWGVIPEAKTTAEKLEMKGEDVNFSNIGKTINEELEGLKKKVESLGKEAQNLVSDENKKQVKSFAEKTAALIEAIAVGLIKTFARAFGFILTIFGLVLITLFIASLFGKLNFIHIVTNGEHVAYSIQEFFTVFIAKEEQLTYVITGLLLLIGIPLISMIYGGIKLLFGIKKTQNRLFSFLSTTLWFAGVVILSYVAYLIVNDFSVVDKHREKITLSQDSLNTLYLQSMESRNYSNQKYLHHSSVISIENWSVIKENDKATFLSFPQMDIVESETDSFELEVIKIACGPTKKEAAFSAKNIQYSLQQSDSLIQFPTYFKLNENEKWRNQKVRLLLKVPESKSVFIHKSMSGVIYDISNVTNTRDKDMLNHTWYMSKEGLACTDCE